MLAYIAIHTLGKRSKNMFVVCKIYSSDICVCVCICSGNVNLCRMFDPIEPFFLKVSNNNNIEKKVSRSISLRMANSYSTRYLNAE